MNQHTELIQKNEAKRLKSDNFMGSNIRLSREKSNIGIAIFEYKHFVCASKIVSYFGGTNNKFVDLLLSN